jgi:hypothetical protein
MLFRQLIITRWVSMMSRHLIRTPPRILLSRQLGQTQPIFMVAVAVAVAATVVARVIAGAIARLRDEDTIIALVLDQGITTREVIDTVGIDDLVVPVDAVDPAVAVPRIAHAAGHDRAAHAVVRVL